MVGVKHLVLSCIVFIWIGIDLQVAAQMLQPQQQGPPVSVTRTKDGHIFLGPDPDSDWELFLQLSDRQMHDGLGLEKEQIKRYEAKSAKFQDDYVRSRVLEREGSVPAGSSARLKAEQQRQAEEFVDELLTPEQSKRLRQLVYRTEAHRIGLGEAHVSGRLSVEVGIYENQKSSLLSRAEIIESEMRSAIAQVVLKAEEKLFAELTPEQRAKALDALGEPFYYKDMTQGLRLYEKIKAEYASKEESK